MSMKYIAIKKNCKEGYIFQYLCNIFPLRLYVAFSQCNGPFKYREKFKCVPRIFILKPSYSLVGGNAKTCHIAV